MTTFVKTVKGATKIKMAPPKRKYLDPILMGTSNPQKFQEIVDALRTRINDTAFTVVYKALCVIHLMIREGDDYVSIDYFSRHPDFFTLGPVSDSGRNSGEVKLLDKYAAYLRTRCKEYRKFHVDYVKDGGSAVTAIISESRNDPSVMLTALDHVESLELQIAVLLKNKYSQGDLSNEMYLFAFKLLIFDLLALYNALNEEIISLLESFFELSHKNAQRTLELYKKFVALTEIVVKYLKVGKSVGLKIPIIKHITTKLVRSLEEHLKEDEVTHVTFNNDADNNVTPSNAQDTNTDTTNLVQQRLGEIRRQKKELEEQLRNPQMIVAVTGTQQPQNNGFPTVSTPSSYNPFASPAPASQTFGAAATFPTAPMVPNIGQQSTPVSATNPFFSSVPQSVTQTPVQGELQSQPQLSQPPTLIDPNAQIFGVTASQTGTNVGSNVGQVSDMSSLPQSFTPQQILPQQQGQQFFQQQQQHSSLVPSATMPNLALAQFPQQQQSQRSITPSSLPYAGTTSNVGSNTQPLPSIQDWLPPVPTGSKNPFSIENVKKQSEPQENNPFSIKNYGEISNGDKAGSGSGTTGVLSNPNNNPFSLAATGAPAPVIFPVERASTVGGGGPGIQLPQQPIQAGYQPQQQQQFNNYGYQTPAYQQQPQQQPYEIDLIDI